MMFLAQTVLIMTIYGLLTNAGIVEKRPPEFVAKVKPLANGEYVIQKSQY